MGIENRLIATGCLIVAASCAARGEMLCSGEGDVVSVDLTSGTRVAAVTERIVRSVAWAEGAVSDAVTVVEVNGVPLDVSEGSGFINWTPPRNGSYTLTHKVISNGVQVGETLTASFVIQGIASVVSLDDGDILCSGESEMVKIDLTPGTRFAKTSERIGYSSGWGWAEGAASESTAIVEANGETMISTSGSGIIDWTPPSNGVYVLTHRVVSHGVQIGETLTATLELRELSIADALGYGGEWTVGGDGRWRSEWTDEAHDGVNWMRSGAIENGQESWIETVVTNRGVLSFWWRASTEEYAGDVFDYAYLSMDGEPQGSLDDNYKLHGVAIGGETGWTNVQVEVVGYGPHVIRWTYVKDEVDESDTGEDCVWLDDVSFTAKPTISFSIGDSADGSVPDSVIALAGTTIVLPTAEGISRTRHTMAGWSDGTRTYAPGSDYVVTDSDVLLTAAWEANTLSAPVISSDDVENGGTNETATTEVRIAADAGATIYYTLDGSEPTTNDIPYVAPFVVDGMSATIRAFAVRDDYFDSDIAEFSFTRLPYSAAECVNADGQLVSTGGEGADAAWVRILGEAAHDGVAAMRSGEIGDGETSSMEMTVEGAGEIAFWWKTSSEISRNRKFDYVSFQIDDVEQSWLGGEKDWTNEVFAVGGGGTHTLRWVYQKDDNGNTMGDDCAWVDEVTWTPVSYSVTFNANGGSGTTAQLDCTYGQSAVLTANGFTRTGHAFVGWMTSANGTTVAYTDGQSVLNLTNQMNATVNLYAKWTDKWYVDTTGDNANQGDSAAQPFKTIQHAINQSVDGMTIIVADGTYEPIRTSNLAITIQSVNGAERTIIDGGNTARCARLSGYSATASMTNTVLRGFTIQNGYSTPFDGGGVYGGSLYDCLVVSNRAERSGGGTCYSALYHCTVEGNSCGNSGGGSHSAMAYDCLFINNSCPTNGGGAYSGVLVNCSVISNRAEKSGGGANSCSLYNCVLANNECSLSSEGYGGGARGGELENCLIYGNRSNNGGGGGVSLAVCRNCTIYGNSCKYGEAGTHAWLVNDLPGGTNFNCIVYGNISTTRQVADIDPRMASFNCYTNDPHFVDAANGDFRLQGSSPCINAGSNLYVNCETDIRGNARIQDGVVDIGAYEFTLPKELGNVPVEGSDVAVPVEWLGAHGLVDEDSTRETLQSVMKREGDNGIPIWESWVTGLDPWNLDSRLLANISIVGGEVEVSWTPDLSNAEPKRHYTVMGKTNLTDSAWVVPASDAHRFFKVKVSLGKENDTEKD